MLIITKERKVSNQLQEMLKMQSGERIMPRKNKKSVAKSHTKKFILTLADEDDLAFVSDLLEQRRKKDNE